MRNMQIKKSHVDQLANLHLPLHSNDSAEVQRNTD